MSHSVDPKLLDILVCPLTKVPLRYDAEAGELISDQAGLAYPIREGIPVMLIDEAVSVDESEDERLAAKAEADGISLNFDPEAA